MLCSASVVEFQEIVESAGDNALEIRVRDGTLENWAESTRGRTPSRR